MLDLFALSTNNKVAVGRESGTLYFYQLPDGKMLSQLDVNQIQNKVWACAFLPNNKDIALCSVRKPIEIWDTQNAALQGVTATRSSSMSISPHQPYLATGYYEIWDLRTNNLKHKLLKGYTDTVPTFSRDGKLLAMRGPATVHKNGSWTGGEICIWDVETGKLRHKIPTLMARHFAFSPDSKYVACIEEIHTSGFGIVNKNLKLFSIGAKRPLWSYTTGLDTERWNDIAFSPNGRWIAVSTSNDYVELRNPATGEVKATLRKGWRDEDIDGSLMNPPNLLFTRDGKYLVLRARHEIRIWDMNEVNARYGTK